MNEPDRCATCGQTGSLTDPCACTVRVLTRWGAIAVVALFVIAGAAFAAPPADLISSESLAVPVGLFLIALTAVAGVVFKLGRYSGQQDRRFDELEEQGTERSKELRATRLVVNRLERELGRLLVANGLMPEPPSAAEHPDID